MLHMLGRWLKTVLLALAAVIVFIEDVGWGPLSRFMGRLAVWPPLARFEDRVRRASPRVAVVMFVLPAVALFPIKLLALWAIEDGHVASGIAVIVVAKQLGTAIVGRLFVLTEPQLMQFAWFRRAIGWWLTTKARVKTAVHQSAFYQASQRTMRRMRARWKLRMRRATRGTR
ncbi:MAG: hypothetical protein JWQ11_691, partial [Rhizobacter sp.]|nr:hypothetical protein [Rhizobacter sp.]